MDFTTLSLKYLNHIRILKESPKNYSSFKKKATNIIATYMSNLCTFVYHTIRKPITKHRSYKKIIWNMHIYLWEIILPLLCVYSMYLFFYLCNNALFWFYYTTENIKSHSKHNADNHKINNIYTHKHLCRSSSIFAA